MDVRGVWGSSLDHQDNSIYASNRLDEFFTKFWTQEGALNEKMATPMKLSMSIKFNPCQLTSILNTKSVLLLKETVFYNRKRSPETKLAMFLPWVQPLLYDVS